MSATTTTTTESTYDDDVVRWTTTVIARQGDAREAGRTVGIAKGRQAHAIYRAVNGGRSIAFLVGLLASNGMKRVTADTVTRLSTIGSVMESEYDWELFSRLYSSYTAAVDLIGSDAANEIVRAASGFVPVPGTCKALIALHGLRAEHRAAKHDALKEKALREANGLAAIDSLPDGPAKQAILAMLG